MAISVTQAPQKGFQVMSEGEALIPKKISTEIRFDQKMKNNGSEGFLSITKFYKNPNGAAILDPNKPNQEWKASVNTGGAEFNKQEKKQPNNKQHGKLLSMISTQSLAVPDKTVFTRTQITYTIFLRGI